MLRADFYITSIIAEALTNEGACPLATYHFMSCASSMLWLVATSSEETGINRVIIILRSEECWCLEEIRSHDFGLLVGTPIDA